MSIVIVVMLVVLITAIIAFAALFAVTLCDKGSMQSKKAIVRHANESHVFIQRGFLNAAVGIVQETARCKLDSIKHNRLK